ncbi:MAG: sn-glycerol-3-phosphate ABC transporter ATP-binding protein UgpC [Halobacteriovoraceae bacterium]|nr:sn-glycerol-3-phosphate ABC transporter ATP-binding protein UgpC [Halobacteriovoraceae bacterium]
MAHLELKEIHKSFGETKVVKGVDLDVQDKEFVVLVGPSGCGKSTLLRMIAGLETVTSGNIIIDGEEATEKEPGDRGVAMVFQDYALYPHMSVFENMAFGLKLKNIEKSEIQSRVQKAAEILDLGSLLERKPSQLSGGQRQRVAMGRAFVKNTSLYLFDEPLSNLDAKLRAKMRLEIKRFHKETAGSIVYVTHDQLEAMTLADKIVVFNKGKIEQSGHPLEVFDFPHSLFVASFIGSPSMNFIRGELSREGGAMSFSCSLGTFPLPEKKFDQIEEGKKVTLGLRPSDLYLSQEEDRLDWQLHAEVKFIELLGKNAYLTLEHGENEFVGEIMGRSLPKQGDKVNVSLNLNHAHLFDSESGVNLLLNRH